MHKSSYLKMQYFKETYLNPNEELKILDIGSFDKDGNYNYGLILNEKKWTYHGLDLKQGNNIDIVVENAYDWEDEIEDETYDLVISGQAFEHIEFFWLTLEQVKRVLKPGGLFFLIVPSTGPVHKNPYDCYRFNENAMKAMAKYINFRVIEYGTNFDKISDPWYDTFLVAKKSESTDIDELEHKIDSLERKVDILMNKLNI
ncbi:bifunctional 2-polyprenyl-6-hydroxyphenol methylase/3-demethylubiquinol 3-O-methyltransferase UbiG [uncultured Methanobrevibacter sp.]|uniref:class I SAM-dependent methyltransferase n=1 Tax=uncultured Methanobrevibacter sp. TaxID=253161 RepID=UPI0025DF33A3|nr:class I SAM-dependent methyltransferase [uncultured Methanobrevibacter sp.]